jgi:hypothetical protein
VPKITGNLEDWMSENFPESLMISKPNKSNYPNVPIHHKKNPKKSSRKHTKINPLQNK